MTRREPQVRLRRRSGAVRSTCIAIAWDHAPKEKNADIAEKKKHPVVLLLAAEA